MAEQLEWHVEAALLASSSLGGSRSVAEAAGTARHRLATGSMTMLKETGRNVTCKIVKTR